MPPRYNIYVNHIFEDNTSSAVHSAPHSAALISLNDRKAYIENLIERGVVTTGGIYTVIYAATIGPPQYGASIFLVEEMPQPRLRVKPYTQPIK